MKLLKEDAIDAASGDAPDGFEIQSDKIVGTGRWSTHHLLILKDAADRFWGAIYSRGATEYQDESPFECEGDEVVFLEYEEFLTPSFRRKK